MKDKFITALMARKKSSYFRNQHIKRQKTDIYNDIYEAIRNGQYKVFYMKDLFVETEQMLRDNGYKVFTGGLFTEINWEEDKK